MKKTTYIIFISFLTLTIITMPSVALAWSLGGAISSAFSAVSSFASSAAGAIGGAIGGLTSGASSGYQSGGFFGGIGGAVSGAISGGLSGLSAGSSASSSGSGIGGSYSAGYESGSIAGNAAGTSYGSNYSVTIGGGLGGFVSNVGNNFMSIGNAVVDGVRSSSYSAGSVSAPYNPDNPFAGARANASISTTGVAPISSDENVTSLQPSLWQIEESRYDQSFTRTDEKGDTKTTTVNWHKTENGEWIYQDEDGKFYHYGNKGEEQWMISKNEEGEFTWGPVVQNAINSEYSNLPQTGTNVRTGETVDVYDKEGNFLVPKPDVELKDGAKWVWNERAGTTYIDGEVTVRGAWQEVWDQTIIDINGREVYVPTAIPIPDKQALDETIAILEAKGFINLTKNGLALEYAYNSKGSRVDPVTGRLIDDSSALYYDPETHAFIEGNFTTVLTDSEGNPVYYGDQLMDLMGRIGEIHGNFAGSHTEQSWQAGGLAGPFLPESPITLAPKLAADTKTIYQAGNEKGTFSELSSEAQKAIMGSINQVRAATAFDLNLINSVMKSSTALPLDSLAAAYAQGGLMQGSDLCKLSQENKDVRDVVFAYSNKIIGNDVLGAIVTGRAAPSAYGGFGYYFIGELPTYEGGTYIMPGDYSPPNSYLANPGSIVVIDEQGNEIPVVGAPAVEQYIQKFEASGGRCSNGMCTMPEDK